MARDFLVNGETMIYCKGQAGSAIASTQELALAADPVRITLNYYHRDINLDAWGGQVPADTQFMLADATIRFTAIHLDRAIMSECYRLSQCGPSGYPGLMGRAGQRMGNNQALFSAGSAATGANAGNFYITLGLSSPVGQLPWQFFYCYLTGTASEWPLGTEKSMVPMTWRAIPFTRDPYNGGNGAFAANFPNDNGAALYINSLAGM